MRWPSVTMCHISGNGSNTFDDVTKMTLKFDDLIKEFSHSYQDSSNKNRYIFWDVDFLRVQLIFWLCLRKFCWEADRGRLAGQRREFKTHRKSTAQYIFQTPKNRSLFPKLTS